MHPQEISLIYVLYKKYYKFQYNSHSYNVVAPFLGILNQNYYF